jgi:hypothetical protein
MRSAMLWTGFLALVLTVGTGCGSKGEGERLGRKLDDAVDRIEEQADDLGDQVEQSADDLGEDVEQFGEDVEDRAEELEDSFE